MTDNFELSGDCNPCEPELAVCYSTQRAYEKELAADCNYEKWDCAIWPRENWLNLGDDEFAIIRKQWIENMGLPFLTYDEFFDSGKSDGEFDKMCEKYAVIDHEFMKILVAIIKELHETGFIKDKLGREIPVIIYCHGDYDDADKLAEHNIEANTPTLVQEFIKFLKT